MTPGLKHAPAARSSSLARAPGAAAADGPNNEKPMRRCCLTLALACLAGLAPPARPDAKPANDKINTKVGNFTLTYVGGRPFALHDVKDARAVVVVFLSFDCPVSNSYAQPLAELHRAYAPKAVAFLRVALADDARALAHS